MSATHKDSPISSPSDPLFLRACRGEPVPRVPVWMMRQAGRFLPEYRAIREHAGGFLDLCRTPELAAQVTLQPIERLGVDAAIVFADILLPLDAMGAGLRFVAGDGPVFDRPVRTAEDIGSLERPDVDRTLGYVFDTVRTVRHMLDEHVPLIGFAGTPWTLATYLVEGGVSKSFAQVLGWSHRDPHGMQRLLETIADVTIDYLLGQIEAGAQALQLFDTWGGLLDEARWRQLAAPSIARILDGISGHDIPTIYYGKGTGHLLTSVAELPFDVLSVDWRLPLDTVRERVGPGPALQGNLDPTALLGTPATIELGVRDVLEAGRRAGGGHVLNLGHGILPMTPVENAQAFIEAAHKYGRNGSD